MGKLKRNERPLEAVVVAEWADGGSAGVFRSERIQGFDPGMVRLACDSGASYRGLLWRREPVRYRVVTRAGQRLDCRWDSARGAFVTKEGFLVMRAWCEDIEEVFADGDVQG